MARRVSVGASLLLGLSGLSGVGGAASMGCGWFEAAESACTAPSQRCDGDAVQVCLPDIEGRSDVGGDVWKTVATCDDDPVLGPYTCRVSDGQATCVPERAHGEAVGEATPDEGPSTWLRVTVVRSGDSYTLRAVGQRLLPAEGKPVGAAFGQLAAVAYQGEQAVDATLVRFADSVDFGATSTAAADSAGANIPAKGLEQVVWLKASAATRVALIDERGHELAQRALDAKGKFGGLEGSSQALAADLPPTLRLFKAADVGRIPLEIVYSMGSLVDPTPEMLSMFAQAYERAPWLASAAITGLGFTTSGVRDTPATGLVGNALFINASPRWLEDFRRDPSRTVLRVIHDMAIAYANLAREPGPGTLRGPSDYPETFALLIRARVSRLIGRREGFEKAWSFLHALAVKVKLAGPYLGDKWASRTPARATEDGFFSPLGGRDPLNDFAETVATLHVPERWVDSPCAVRVKGVNDLPTRSLLPFAKVEVVYALGLVTDEVAEKCRFVLSAEVPSGLTLFTPEGRSVTFASELSATRQPYLRGQIHATVQGSRGDVKAMIDVGYRGRGEGLYPLVAASARPDKELGAGIYLTQETNYASTDSVGGVLLVTELSPERMRMLGLFVQQRGKAFGTQIFPLVTANFEAPLWVE